MKTNLTPNGEDTILEPGGQLDNTGSIESRPPVDIDTRLDSILTWFMEHSAGDYPNSEAYQTTKAQLKTLIAAQVAAAEQQLLTELLGEANTYSNDGDFSDDAPSLVEAVPVSIIERLQNKTNDGGRNGASEKPQPQEQVGGKQVGKLSEAFSYKPPVVVPFENKHYQVFLEGLDTRGTFTSSQMAKVGEDVKRLEYSIEYQFVAEKKNPGTKPNDPAYISVHLLARVTDLASERHADSTGVTNPQKAAQEANKARLQHEKELLGLMEQTIDLLKGLIPARPEDLSLSQWHGLVEAITAATIELENGIAQLNARGQGGHNAE